jgi:hypothetical protein
MTKLFHIKVQFKRSKVDTLFNSGSHDNLITTDLIKNLGMEVHDHHIPYPLGWVNKECIDKGNGIVSDQICCKC